ncbi:Flagellar hook-length control protein-like protein [Burkholderia sp. BT03]|nr:Flagellar hook-length control protein-like protein [Burkholderia sp. BT03]
MIQTPSKKIASLDPKATQDALQAAFAAMANGQGATPATGVSASAGSGTSSTGDAMLGGTGAGAGKGLTLGDLRNMKGDATANGMNATAPTTPAAAAAAQPSPAETLAAASASVSQASAVPAANTDTSAALAATQAASAAAAASATTTVTQGSNPATAAMANAIAPQVGAHDWEDAFSQKVVFLTNAHQQTAELTLNPRDLGPLQVVLQVADNHAHALFVSQHQQVREAVEAALPKLREAMEQGGIGLGSASVSDGFARQSSHQGQEQSGGARGGRSNGRGDAGIDVAGGSATTVNVPVRRTVGLVDTFA